MEALDNSYKHFYCIVVEEEVANEMEKNTSGKMESLVK